MPHTYHLSASSISAYKACPTRFRLAYVEGIRPAEATETLRYGTNWHKLPEIFANTEGDDDARLAAVVEHLNKTYEICPLSIDAKDWAIERQILSASFIGYQWFWSNDPIEFLASEVPFKLPLMSPRTGMPLATNDVVRVGKIDHVVRWQGVICSLERKSTSRSIDPSSEYWDRSRKDTQVSMYALAFRDMGLGNTHEGERAGNTLYDVWHRPTIKPAMLTQKETREFLESSEYYGTKFEVKFNGGQGLINGVVPEIEQGKKAIAIRETPEMYGARLLHDITERPEFYFARKEIVRTDQDIEAFKGQLYAIYQSQRATDQSGHWYENEHSCDSPFRCQYKNICFGTGAAAVCDGTTVPAGYKRIFVDLTVNEQPQSE